MDSKVISESGDNYVKFGNGLLIQWGNFGAESPSSKIWEHVFLHPYKKYVNAIACINTTSTSTGFQSRGMGIYSTSLTSLTVYGWNHEWISIGY